MQLHNLNEEHVTRYTKRKFYSTFSGGVDPDRVS